MKKIVLFGAGGMGREVARIIETINQRKSTYELMGFLVSEDYYRPGEIVNGYPVLGTEQWILEHKKDVYCTCAIGFAADRARIQERLMQEDVKFETIIAPGVDIPEFTTVGCGCVFFPGIAMSVNCEIGKGVFLNSYVTVGHDAKIGDYSCVMPATGISGYCKIGKEVDIGGHAFIIPRKKIGDSAKVAAGSIVFSNVKAGTTVLGNPAKRMSCLED